ncbi:MAG: hypothetical protein ACFB0G_25180 [Leptolyngbyaceae cyanobacterium]
MFKPINLPVYLAIAKYRASQLAEEISEQEYTGTVRAGLASHLQDHRYQASIKPAPTGGECGSR